MKGTLKEITGQTTGFWLGYECDYEGEVINLTCQVQTSLIQRDFNTNCVLTCDKRSAIKIENVFAWLIQEGWIQLDGNTIIRDYVTDNEADITLESLNRPGIIYDFEDRRFLAPLGWE
jgi:hypothetical protein